MVVHFYRGVTPRCQIVDAHFHKLAPLHLETRFVKIDAEKNPFLVERLGVIIMPTIGKGAQSSPSLSHSPYLTRALCLPAHLAVLIKNGKTEHALHGFDELGGTDDFTTEDMAYVLSTHKVLKYDVDRTEEIAARAKRAGFNSMSLNMVKRGQYDDMSDDNMDD